MIEFPRVLYRGGAKIKIGAVSYDTLVVADEGERASALKAGWSEYDDMAEPRGPLDGSVKDLTEYLATIDDADTIRALIADEKAGKTRTSALAALNARLEEL